MKLINMKLINHKPLVIFGKYDIIVLSGDKHDQNRRYPDA